MKPVLLGMLTLALGSLAFNAENEMYDLAISKLRNLQIDPVIAPISEAFDDEDSISNTPVFSLPIDYIEEQQVAYFNSVWKSLPAEAIEAHELLKAAAANDHPDATFAMLEINLLGALGFPLNATLALEYAEQFERIRPGNSTVLYYLGFIHSTGLFGEVPRDEPKGLVYYHMAAEKGSLQAKQVLGYKYATGTGVQTNLNRAMLYYGDVADTLWKRHYNNFSGFITPMIDSYNVRICDFNGGLLGAGLSQTPTSVFRTNPAAENVITSDYTEEETKYIRIYLNALASFQGTYSHDRNFTYSASKFREIIDHYDGKTLSTAENHIYGRATVLLGRQYKDGLGVEQDFEEAERLFMKTTKRSTQSRVFSEMGLLYEFIHRDMDTAMKWYKKAVKEDYAPIAHYRLGMNLLSDPLHLSVATEHFRTSAFHHYIPAEYRMAKILENGQGTAEEIVKYYKFFVEHNQHIMTELRGAFENLLGNYAEAALVKYAMAAEQGYEEAMVSAAYLLYQPTKLFEELPQVPVERAAMAIEYYSRAAELKNTDAAVITGNILFNYGEYARAFKQYSGVAMNSAQGSWNLGYMHEHGLGVARNFKKAKKYYDDTLQFNKKLYIAVKLSLLKLYVKSWYLWTTGVDVEWDQDPKNETNLFAVLFAKNNSGNWSQWVTSLGLYPEDLIVIAGFFGVVLAGLLLQHFAVRNGWNVVINGVQVGNPRPDAPQAQVQVGGFVF